MKDDDFRHQDDDVSDRTDDGPVQNGARAVAEGMRTRSAQVWEGADNYMHGPEPERSQLGDEAGMPDLPPIKKGVPTVEGHKETIRYADGGAIPSMQQALYGAPLSQNDDTGAAVNPMISSQRGGTAFGNASPQTSFADGGAIPDDSGVDATDADDTTQAFSQALKAVNAGLMYGRQKHGLPTGGSDGDQDDSGGSSDGDQDDGGSGGSNLGFKDGGAIPSYADGGTIQDDIDASNNSPRGDDYGRPQQVDDPDAIHPPISSDNSNYPAEDQYGGPGTGDDNSGALPVAAQEQDNSGALPVAEGQQSVGQNLTPLAYLMGTDAVPPEVLDSYKQGAAGSESDRNLAAVNNAFQDKGPEGAYGVVQALRRKFDLFMNHGRAAVNEGDYASAANSATQALNNLPDGANVTFAPTKDGLVARLQAAGSTQATTVPLSKAAADAFMNTGKDGQFDALLTNGVQSALQKVAGSLAPGAADRIGSQVQAAGTQPQKQNTDPKAVRIMSRQGVTNGWGAGEPVNGKGGSGNSGIEREKLRQEGLNKRAQMTADRQTASQNARAQIEQQKALQLAKRMEMQSNNAQLQERGKLARAEISNPNFLLQSDEQRAAILKKYRLTPEDMGLAPPGGGQQHQTTGGNQQTQTPPAVQSASGGQQQQRPANVPQGAKLYKGKWYTRGQNGEAVLVE